MGISRSLIVNNIIKLIFTRNKFQSSAKPKITLIQLQKKLKEHNVIITKADKDNSVVLIDRVEYDDKMQESLQSIWELILILSQVSILTMKISVRRSTIADTYLTRTLSRRQFKFLLPRPLVLMTSQSP